MKRIKLSIATVGLVAILFLLSFAFLSYERFHAAEIKEASANLERCMSTFRELLMRKGEGFKIENGQLMAGRYVINGNFDIPDHIQEIFGETATVFMGDVRISTNVLQADGRRAVDTRLEGAAYESIFNQGKIFRGETLILGVPYLTAYDPIRDGNGKIIGALYVGMKKSEFLAQHSELKTQLALILFGLLTVFTTLVMFIGRLIKKAEREKEADNRFLQTLINTIPNPVYYKDVHGKYIGGNKAFAEFLGTPIEQLIGKTLFDVLPNAEANHIHKGESELYQGNNLLLEDEISIAIGDGTCRDVINYKATFRAEDGSFGGFVGTILDISKRKQIEVELVKQAQLASLRAEIGGALGRNRDLRDILQQCAELLVQYLNVAFFRIWTLNDAEQMLEMQASAGMYTHIDGPHGQVPVGMSKIGIIASEHQPHLTNDVINDPLILDREWARQEGMIAFAGYPLIVADRLVGVMACFARTALNEEILGELGSFAGRIAQCIERKRAEAEVNFKNLILSTQQECASDGILVVNDIGSIISYNRRFVEMWGIPPELVATGADEPVLLFVAKQPVDEEGFLARIRYLYEHPEEKSREEIVLKDGRVFDRYSAPMTGSDGRYYGRVWYFSDITVRKQLEEDMNKSRDAAKEYAQRLEFVLKGSDDATWELDVITNQAILNKRYYEMIECPPGEVESTFGFLLKTIHPDDVDDVQRRGQDCLTGKTDGYEAHYRIITKSGKLKHVFGRGKIVRYDEEGRPLKMAGVITDVSEMKRLSDEVNRINNLESIGLLSVGLAHDFNNVLNIIYGNITFVKMLAEGNATFVEPLTDAEEACERAKALGTRLQAFSQEGIPLREPIMLPALIEDAAEALFKGSNISHTISAADDVHQLEAAPRQIRQLFENLLSNAKDAMTGGGTVTINIENCDVDGKKELSLRSGPYVCITIQDDGSGIPEVNLPKIFDPYFSTKDTYSQRGMGLGLSICLAIMKRHNGQIFVESTVGIGTRVTLYLPTTVEKTEHSPKE